MARLPKPGDVLRQMQKVDGKEETFEYTVLSNPYLHTELKKWVVNTRWTNPPHWVTEDIVGYTLLFDIEQGQYAFVKDSNERQFFRWMYEQDIKISAGLFNDEGEPE